MREDVFELRLTREGVYLRTTLEQFLVEDCLVCGCRDDCVAQDHENECPLRLHQHRQRGCSSTGKI
jgi:hypothetical protein